MFHSHIYFPQKFSSLQRLTKNLESMFYKELNKYVYNFRSFSKDFLVALARPFSALEVCISASFSERYALMIFCKVALQRLNVFLNLIQTKVKVSTQVKKYSLTYVTNWASNQGLLLRIDFNIVPIYSFRTFVRTFLQSIEN